MSEASKTLIDPMTAPVIKTLGITGSGAVGMAFWGYSIAELTALVGLIFGLQQIITLSPKFWASIKWWFGKDRRRPDYLEDDSSKPRQRDTDHE